MLQSCPTLCDPIDHSPPGSSVIPGILQARIPEWVAVSFSNAWKWKVKVKSFSCVWLLAIPWTAAYQLLHPWDFPGKSTGVGCHFLLHYKVYFAPNPPFGQKEHLASLSTVLPKSQRDRIISQIKNQEFQLEIKERMLDNSKWRHNTPVWLFLWLNT